MSAQNDDDDDDDNECVLGLVLRIRMLILMNYDGYE